MPRAVATMTGPQRRRVVALALAQTLIWACIYYSFPALLLHWQSDLGWSKTELSGAFTVALVASGIAAPIAGRIIDAGHTRVLMVGGTGVSVVLLILLSSVDTVVAFYLCWLGLGLAMACTLYEPCFAYLTRIMGSKARSAITMVTLFAGFAGTVSFPTANGLAEWLGWRGALIGLAALALFIVLPLNLYGTRGTERSEPDRLPDGDGNMKARAPTPTRKVLRSPTFILLAIGFCLMALNHGAILTHLLPLLADRGVEAGAAVLAASMIGPMQVLGRLVMLTVEKFVSMIVIAMMCYAAIVVAGVSIYAAAVAPLLITLFVVLQGAGWGVSSIARPVVTADLLGRENFGVISGAMAVPFLLGGALAPIAAALVWQAGGYDLVIVAAITAAILGLGCFIAAIKVEGRTAHDSRM